jgi:hypothetical protein
MSLAESCAAADRFLNGSTAPPFVISPGLLQKVFGARDDHAVRLGVGSSD